MQIWNWQKISQIVQRRKNHFQKKKSCTNLPNQILCSNFHAQLISQNSVVHTLKKRFSLKFLKYLFYVHRPEILAWKIVIKSNCVLDCIHLPCQWKLLLSSVFHMSLLQICPQDLQHSGDYTYLIHFAN